MAEGGVGTQSGESKDGSEHEAAAVAHDLNNLLSVILCYTGFVLDALPVGSPLRQDLLAVEKASRQATELARQHFFGRDRAEALGEAAPAATHQRTPFETILVVEDDETVRQIAARILTGAGYTVLTAASGAEALRLCETHSGVLSLVLADLVMPQVSGRAFAAQLRGLRSITRILYMSGYSNDASHGILEPGTRFIGKPFTASELCTKVREFLDEVA